MMTAALSRRVGACVGAHLMTYEERTFIVDGVQGAEDWPDVPPKVRALIEDCEARPLKPGIDPQDFGGLTAAVGLDTCTFCRNPLHPGPCAKFHPGVPRRDDPSRTEPVAGPGRPRKKLGLKNVNPKAVEDEMARMASTDPPPIFEPDAAGAAFSDLQKAVAGDGAARARVEALARELYTFTDEGTGLRTEVVGVTAARGMAHRGAGVSITSHVFNADGRKVGDVIRTWRLPPGEDRMAVRHGHFSLSGAVQGGGFSRRFNARAYQGYREMGVSRVTLTADDTVGGAAWALEGYDITDRNSLSSIADHFRQVSNGLRPGPIKAQIDELLSRSTEDHWRAGTHPTAYEFVQVGSEHAQDYTLDNGRVVRSWLGKRTMAAITWEGVLPISEPWRPEPGITAAAADPGDGWNERAGFLDEVRSLSDAYSNVVADEVPACPDVVEEDIPEDAVNDCPEHHHYFGADPPTTDVYLELATDLLDKWGRLDGGHVLDQQAIVAHAGCSHGEFCRAPLHPGPCKGWKKKIAPTPVSVPGPTPTPTPPTPRKRAKKAVPAPVPVKSIPPPAAPPAGTPSAKIHGGDFTGVTQVGPQGGSNPGGIFETSDGKRFYMKAASSEAWARQQALAADLYRLAGLDSPHITVGKGAPISGGAAGSWQTATEIVPGLSAPGTTPKFKKALQDGFAVDAWLADWDIGQGGNAMSTSTGDPIRMDIGGSLEYRARGGNKGAAFGDTVGEWTTMRDPRNVSGRLFQGMTDDQLIASAARVAAISDADIRNLVAHHGQSTALADRLIKRRDDIKKRGDALAATKARQQAAQAALSNAGPGPTVAIDHIAADDGVALARQAHANAQTLTDADAADKFLRAVADLQGFSNAPTNTTAYQVGKLGTAGTHTVAYRGVKAKTIYDPVTYNRVATKTGKDIQDEFRSGNAYFGRGIYGYGYYFSTNQGTARSYSDSKAGSMIRIAIPTSTAKTIDWNTLSTEHSRWFNALPQGDARRDVFHNPGIYAVARGYELIEVPQGQRRMGQRPETYYVVLNRGIVTVPKST